MPTHLFLREIDLPDEQLERELDAAFGPNADEWLPPEEQKYTENSLLKGRVLRVTSDAVLVDVGFKSEGVIDLREWYEETANKVVPPRPGDEVRLLLQALEDDTGAVVLSYRRARSLAEWEAFTDSHKEGDIVPGVVTRKIKGGLLVNVGVNGFLPASQVDIRRPRDLGDYFGQTIECKITRIDNARRNVVVSRREVLEEQRERMKKQLLVELEPGQIRKGVVKNITTFGAFVDLGGTDGLLHITDMSWDRVTDPHDVVAIDQQLDVYVVNVNRETGKIALGLKQLVPSPWADVAEKYPVGSEHEGEVVSVANYGAFVALAPGLQGLVHVSQMSRGRRFVQPGEVVQEGDRVTCVVLDVDVERKRISLGLKRTEIDPWDGDVASRYAPGEIKKGKIAKLTNFGAFVELEPGLDGLLHLSEMADQKGLKPEDLFQAGDEVDVRILRVDVAGRKIALSRKGLTAGEETEDQSEAVVEKTRPKKQELRGGTGTGP